MGGKRPFYVSGENAKTEPILQPYNTNEYVLEHKQKGTVFKTSLVFEKSVVGSLFNGSIFKP